MRFVVQRIFDALVTGIPGDAEITLDQIGEAIGVHALSPIDIEELFDALEAGGRRVAAPASATTDDLRRVIPAARALERKLGRRPVPDEIAAETGLPCASVRTALLFAQIMGR